MKLSHIAVAVAGLVSLGAANATLSVLGAVTIGTPVTFSSLSAPGPFSDTYTFSLPLNGGTAYSASNFSLVPTNLNALLNTLSVVSDPDGIPYTPDDQVLQTVTAPGSSSIHIDLAAVAPGKYYILVSGINTGGQGGQYNGSISAVAAPVPEPASYLTMLAGLSVVGFIAAARNRRRG